MIPRSSDPANRPAVKFRPLSLAFPIAPPRFRHGCDRTDYNLIRRKLRYYGAHRLGVSTSSRHCPVNVCGALVLSVRSVRDLGVHLDSDVSMRVHINLQVRSCFSALRQIRSMRRSMPTTALLTLIRALVISKVYYCISVLVGTSGYLLDRLQSVLNTAARLVFGSRRSDHITPS